MPSSLHRISYRCGNLRQNMLNDCLFGIVIVVEITIYKLHTCTTCQKLLKLQAP